MSDIEFDSVQEGDRVEVGPLGWGVVSINISDFGIMTIEMDSGPVITVSINDISRHEPAPPVAESITYAPGIYTDNPDDLWGVLYITDDGETWESDWTGRWDSVLVSQLPDRLTRLTPVYEEEH